MVVVLVGGKGVWCWVRRLFRETLLWNLDALDTQSAKFCASFQKLGLTVFRRPSIVRGQHQGILLRFQVWRSYFPDNTNASYYLEGVCGVVVMLLWLVVVVVVVVLVVG